MMSNEPMMDKTSGLLSYRHSVRYGGDFQAAWGDATVETAYFAKSY